MPSAILPIQLAGGIAHPSVPVLNINPGAHGSDDDTWTRGAILIESGNTAGGVVESTSGDDLPTLGAVIGVAAHKWAPSVTTPTIATKAQIIPALPGIIFEGTLTDAAGTYVLVATDILASYGLTRDSTTGLWFVAQDDTTDHRVYVIQAVSEVGDLYPRVRFVFKTNATVYSADASN